MAPQVLITLPLLLTYAVTGYVFTYVLLVLHLAASTPDILNVLRILTVFRGSKFKLCKEVRKVVGVTVIKPGGDCIIYKAILSSTTVILNNTRYTDIQSLSVSRTLWTYGEHIAITSIQYV